MMLTLNPSDTATLSLARIADYVKSLAAAPVVAPPLNALRAVTPVGMNLATTNYYSTNFLFLDRMKTASDWSNNPTLDADGWPSALSNGQPASVLINVDGPLSGVAQIYVVECANTAVNFSFAGAAVVSSDVVNGKRRIVIDASGAIHDQGYRITLTIDAPVSGTPIVIFRQDQEAALKAGGIFTPETLTRLAKFSPLRLMDWLYTNNNISPDWAARIKPSYYSWNQVPLEICVALLNALGVDGWFNVPMGVSDDYIAQMVTLVHGSLSPGLRLYLEYSNEVWNTGQFTQHNYADALTAPIALGDGYELYPKVGYLAARMAAVALKTANFSPRVRPVLMGQAGVPEVITRQVQGAQITIADWCDPTSPRYDASLASHCSSFNQVFGGIGVAAYFDGIASGGASAADKAMVEGWAAATDDSGLAAAFHQIEFGGALGDGSVSLAAYPPLFAGLSDLAKSLQVPLLGYEGGFDPISGNVWPNSDPKQGLVTAFFQRITIDPRAKAIVAKWFAIVRQAGFSLLCNYNDVGSALSPIGIWGALVDAYHQDAPRHLALLDAVTNAPALPIGVSIAETGVSMVGLNNPTTITVSGGVGRVTLSVAGMPDGRSYDGNREIVGTRETEQTVTMQITATDESGAAPVTFPFVVTVAANNEAPGSLRYFRFTPNHNTNGNVAGDQYFRLQSSGFTPMLAGSALDMTGAKARTTFQSFQSDPSALVDNDPTTFWASTPPGDPSYTITIDMGRRVKPDSFQIGASDPSNSPNYSVAEFKLIEGSADDVTWVLLATNPVLSQWYATYTSANVPLTYPTS